MMNKKLSTFSFLPLKFIGLLILPQEGNQKRHEQPTNSVRRSLKRKLEDEFIVDRKITSSDDATQQDLLSEVRAQVKILDYTFSSNGSDRALVKRSIHILSELAKNVVVDFCLCIIFLHLITPPLYSYGGRQRRNRWMTAELRSIKVVRSMAIAEIARRGRSEAIFFGEFLNALSLFSSIPK
ncbi:unnamed protein product [Lactuca saligna]|uniref:Uncharacterized protein n=1 Tax=Lactuca saligna TaxID=75948 RepID=A0AA35Y0I1_LACSI|nr:unnamed protein product [Lactuca saligna]